MVKALEALYQGYGLIGLFIASFFEGLIYVGLYFAGSFIILFVVLFSDGSLISLLTVSIVVSAALMMSSIVNYVLGRYFVMKTDARKDLITKKNSKSLLLSLLHPNSMAFYFFNLGLKKESIGKILLVPLVIIPWGFLLAFLFYQIKPVILENTSSPYILITVLLVWFIVAFILKNRESVKDI